MTYQVRRYHDISCGHRVVGHEGKCRHLHGHNYRIHFVCESAGKLDHVGRVIDFSDIKYRLCMWLEQEWDHKMLISHEDPILKTLRALDPTVVIVPFNPTAENLAKHLVEVVGPDRLMTTNVRLVEVTIEETAKCSATYRID